MLVAMCTEPWDSHQSWGYAQLQPLCFAVAPLTQTTALTLYNDNAESVEWFNMCWRKVEALPLKCGITQSSSALSMVTSNPLYNRQTAWHQLAWWADHGHQRALSVL